VSRGQFFYAKGWVGHDSVSDKSTKAAFAALITLLGYVLGGGFTNGIYTHILLTTGLDISSEEHVYLILYNVTCGAINHIPNSQQYSDECYETYNAINSAVSLADFFTTVFPIILLALAIAGFFATSDDQNLLIIGLVVGFLISASLNFVAFNVGFSLVGGSSNLPTTATTSVPTTSTSSISTTSTSTTTIPPRYTDCVGNKPFNCTMPTFSQKNKSLSFNLTLNGSGQALYNVHLACVDDLQNTTPTCIQFFGLQSNGTLIRSNTSGTTFYDNSQIYVKSLTCIDVPNNAVSFNGEIWVAYTSLGYEENLCYPSQSNPWWENVTGVYINTTMRQTG